jgi:protocatechuate 3,4-dioxygenase beta subunit
MGRTVDAVSGKPIGDVVVTLNLMAPPFAGYPAVVSDEQGRFVVRDLPKGAFRFYAVKPGYIPGAYKKRLPVGDDYYFGQPLDLGDAERALDVTITLWKYAVIEGTVTDEGGDPVVGTTVRALPRRVIAGRSQLAFDTPGIPFGSYVADTDDRGMFRLTSLPPGDYVVAVPVVVFAAPKSRPASASLAPTAATSSSSSGLFSWTSGARGGGTGVGGVEAGDELFGLVSTSASETFAGFTPQGRPLVYETQFFPNSTTLGRAEVVTVASGDVRSAVDFRLRPAPASKIAGIASGPNGPAANLTLRLVSAEMSATSGDAEVAITTTDGQGRFVFLGVTPGQYAIRTVDVPRPRATPGTSASQVQVSGGRGVTIISSGSTRATTSDDPTWWADTPVAVGDRDVRDVTISLKSGARIRGRVEFEGTAAPPTLTRAGLSLLRADGQRAINYQLTEVLVDEQWRITSYQQVPGPYLLRAYGNQPGWYFAGAFVGSRDVSILPVEIGANDVNDVVIKFTDKPLASITGTVTNGQGQPDTRATAIIFPADRTLWTNYGPNPRMLRAASTGRDGQFVADNLPAGEYLAAAVANLALTWADPKSLEPLARYATRVTLRDRETATVALRVTAGAASPTVATFVRSSRFSGIVQDIAESFGHGPFVPDDSDQQTRDAATPASSQAGTARIAGVISLDTEGRTPAARVTVTLASGTPGSGIPGGSRAVITGETGRFDFPGLPAGRYVLTANKPAYLTATYGATRVDGPTPPIVLADGQQLTSVVLPIRKGAVVTGVIRDERGQAMPGASVQLLTSRNVNGERRLTTVVRTAQIKTDDRGVYRVYGLPPGEYYVSAAANYVTGTARPTTTADVQFAQQPAAPATAGSRPAPRRYVPVLYPGVFTTDGAQVLKVGVGEERGGIDFALRMVPAVSIEGTVTSTGGALPLNLEVRLVSVGDVIPSTGITDIASVLPMRLGPEGRFAFPGVAPGQYVVAAVTQNAAGRGRGAAADTPSSSFWGMANVEVNGLDVSNVVVTLQPGMSLSGRIRFDGSTLPAPTDLSAVRVSLVPQLTAGQVAAGQTSATAGPDGSFAFTGLTPGRYYLRATAATEARAGWLIKEVTAAGQDATDGAFELKVGDNVTNASIVFGDRPAELSGTLQDASGRPATDYFVLLLPADPARWRSTNRRVQQVRPLSDGKFTFRALLPGNYLLAAATELEPGATADTEFLTELAKNAVKVTIAEGEKKVQDIRIGK